MNFINLVPGIFVAVFLAMNLGLIFRFLLEGATIKLALKSTARAYGIPLIFIYLIYMLYKDRRKILFEMKNSSDVEDEIILKWESILASKWKLFVFFLTLFGKMYRLLIDALVTASIEFEEKKQKDKLKKTQNESSKFLSYYIDGIDIEKHIFL